MTKSINLRPSPDKKAALIEQINSRTDYEVKVPYRTRFNLTPLLTYWEKLVDSSDYGTAFLAKHIVDKAKEYPELWEPLGDNFDPEPYQDILSLICTSLYPATHHEHLMARAIRPYTMESLFDTPKIMELLQSDNFSVQSSKQEELKTCFNTLNAGVSILNTFYGQDIKMDDLSLFTLKHENGECKHFKVKVSTQFMEIKQVKPLKKLSQEVIDNLLKNVFDINAWLEALPRDHFEFHGIVLVTLIDITEEESLSLLKHQLLQKNAVIAEASISKLEELLRVYFNNYELRLGITAVDYPPEYAVLHEYKIKHHLLAEHFNHLLDPAFDKSLYQKACHYGEVLTVENLEHIKSPTTLEQALIDTGLKSIIIAPLKNKEDRVVGLLELASPSPFAINSLTTLKLREILPLFRTALMRSRDEVDNTLEGIIREQYTAIHPSVEWKFIQNAYKIMEKRELVDEQTQVEPIVFKDIYPLYGQADIVSSSHIRNEAIKIDLLTNLRYALEALEKMNQFLHIPIIMQYIHQVNHLIRQLEFTFNSNDEYRIMTFLRDEIGDLFTLFEGKNEYVDEALRQYKTYIYDELGIVYNVRKQYEESVTMINEVLGSYLGQQQVIMQQTLPHYFEIYKTDGVEYDIYLGQELLNHDTFHPIHLQNMRLWQLISMCEMTRNVENLRPRLSVPLTTAQLVFVHNNPLSIRFRLDEKQFDVDGAYNARYEIIKKRIDKSRIKGTGERLTVSGKIAIVYTANEDREEYQNYLNHLISEKYISPEIEDVELEELQAVQGLRAIRLSVLHTNGEPITGIDRDELLNVLKKVS